MDNPKTRLDEWKLFSQLVENHISKYCNDQYQDKGKDPITNWSYSQCMDQIRKYYKRKDSNQRKGENKRDLLKIAHYACVSYFKLLEIKEEEKEDLISLTKNQKEFIIETVRDILVREEIPFLRLENILNILE